MSIEDRENIKATFEEEMSGEGVASVVSAVRKEVGLTQAHVAKKMGTDHRAFRRLEKGDGGQPRVDTVRKAAAAMGYHARVVFVPKIDEPDAKSLENRDWLIP